MSAADPTREGILASLARRFSFLSSTPFTPPPPPLERCGRLYPAGGCRQDEADGAASAEAVGRLS
jgi:hypothetical protein